MVGKGCNYGDLCRKCGKSHGQHNMAGKSWVELYGEEKAKEMKEHLSDVKKGQVPPEVKHSGVGFLKPLGQFLALNFCECGCGGLCRNRFMKGHSSRSENNPMYGKRGKDSPSYKHGLYVGTHDIYGEYHPEFSQGFCKKIRKRDGYMCWYPGCGVKENGQAHHVHHIDGDKNNIDESNFITLCGPDHSQVTSASSNPVKKVIWQLYFEDLMVARDLA